MSDKLADIHDIGVIGGDCWPDIWVVQKDQCLHKTMNDILVTKMLLTNIAGAIV